ncbi:hypothetical protein [Shinella sp.]|uniref:hypothetical protein n=1 Tax=Shinella sp. TaxID=1870904 RepID=UPI002588F63C|nr:hypothetical protein [Shinella sp.]MCW5706749.1 hypothetical protein [Shinella sp.]
MSTEAATVPQEDLIIEAYGGDARAAVRELLADADFLRDQLYTASVLVSKGYARSWKPQYERP